MARHKKDGATTPVIMEIDTEELRRADEAIRARGLTMDAYVNLQLRALNRSGRRTIELGGRMGFGKYEGADVEDVVRSDPAYVRWLGANLENVSLGVGVLQLLDTLQ